MRFLPGMMANEELLSLPKSINSYIVLRESLRFSPDVRLYLKIIHDYLDEIPLFEVANIVLQANTVLSEYSYLHLLDMIFKH